MKIYLSNVIVIEKPTKQVLDYFTKKLTYDNPDYLKKKNMGFYAYGTPKTIKLFNYYENKLYIPMGCFEDLWSIHPISDDYTDYCIEKPVNIESNIVLRDYQKPCVNALKDYYNVVISMGCGMGKTLSLLAAVGEIKQRTLWLAGTIDLVRQAQDSCKKFMKCKTSLITEGKMSLEGDIVFATIASVYKFIQNGELKPDEFGCIILDECHHLSANPNSLQMFRSVFEYFPAKYRAGMSATIWRTDGLEKCIIDIIGKVRYNIEQKGDHYSCMYNGECLMQFPITRFQVPCRVNVIETKYDVSNADVFSSNGGTIQFASLISDIAMNKERNSQILSVLKSVKGSTIVLSDRVDQLEYLGKHLDNAIVITGSTPKKIRKQGLDDVRCGKIKYLLSSYQLAKEGLDCVILENLIMATPIKAFSSVVQSIGRIQRPYEGKEIANIYDFCDSEVGMLLRFYSKRRSIYKKNNWKIENTYLGGGK